MSLNIPQPNRNLAGAADDQQLQKLQCPGFFLMHLLASISKKKNPKSTTLKLSFLI